MPAVTIQDVAGFFLSLSPMTHKKLQKLCYYAQAWHLALFDTRLFNSSFEAWIHGPVCPDLYQDYKAFGWNDIPPITNPLPIDKATHDYLQMVYDTYGEFNGDELEALCHTEKPWLNARKGLDEFEPSHNEISEEDMKVYYRAKFEQDQND